MTIPWTLPDIQTNPLNQGSSVPDTTDLLELAGQTGAGWVSGAAVAPTTSPSFAVQVAAGVVTIGGGNVTVQANAALAMIASNVTDRRDLVLVGTNGMPYMKAGTPCQVAGWTVASPYLPPVKPAPDANTVILAEVYITGNTPAPPIQAGAIIDKRIPANLTTQAPGLTRSALHDPVLADCQCASLNNVNIASPGATFDGFTLTQAGHDQLFLWGQSTPSQNGPWVWNGAASPLTRPTDFASGLVLKLGKTIRIENGTQFAGRRFDLTASNGSPITIDTTAQTWTPAPYGTFGPAAKSGVVFVNPGGSDSLAGDSPGNAKLTLTGALGALPGGGGVVLLGEGTIAPGSGATIDLAADITIAGAGMNTSGIQWTSDIGTNEPGILCFSGNGNQRSVLRDLFLLGPAGRTTPSAGVAPASTMWGVKTGGKTTMQRVWSQGFWAPIAIGSNHETLLDCEAHGGWYNMYWVNTNTAGNETLINVDLSTAALASMAVANGAQISAAIFEMVYLGQAPFGVYIEDRTVSGGGWCSDSRLFTNFETIGNSLVYDATRSAADKPGISHSEWFVGEVSYVSGSGRASAYPFNYAFDTTIGTTTFIDIGGVTTPPGGISIWGSYAGTNTANDFDQLPRQIQVNGAAPTALRPVTDFIAGTGVTLVAADDATNLRTTITVNATTGTGVTDLFGDGSDGVVIFDGTTTILGVVPSAGVYTLIRPLFANTIEVQSGATINTNNYPIFAATSITVDAGGFIVNNGGAGLANGTAGVNNVNNVYGLNSGGAGNSATAGGNGSGSNLGAGCGRAGSGGAGSSTAGGTSSSPTAGTNTWVYKMATILLLGIVSFGAAAKTVGGANGGGGGGGDGTNKGGGGGASGGVVALLSPTIVNSGTISAAGGNGGTPTTGNCGGGGPGGGGAIVAVTTTAWTAGTTNVAAGTAGSGVGSGAAGAVGAAGTVVNVVL